MTRYLIKFFFIIFAFFSSISLSHSNEEAGYILKALKNTGQHNLIIQLINQSNLYDLFSKETVIPRTFYAPKDEAFKDLPEEIYKKIFVEKDSNIARKILINHLFAGKHEYTEVSENGMVTINLDGKILKIYKNEDLFVKDMVIINKDIEINNGLVRSVDCVMFVQPSKDDIRLDSETRNIYSITSCCLRTEEEVKLFLSTI